MTRIRYVEKVRYSTHIKLKVRSERFVKLARKFVKADLPLEVRMCLAECFLGYMNPDVSRWMDQLNINVFNNNEYIDLAPIDDLSEKLAEVLLDTVTFPLYELENMRKLITTNLLENGTSYEIVQRIRSPEVRNYVIKQTVAVKKFIKDNAEIVINEGFVKTIRPIVADTPKGVSFRGYTNQLWTIKNIIKEITELKYGT